MSKIGYIRVSIEHQETARQQEIMCDYSHSTYIQNYKDIKKHSEQNRSKICDDVKTLLFCVLKHTNIFQQDSIQENTAGEI